MNTSFNTSQNQNDNIFGEVETDTPRNNTKDKFGPFYISSNGSWQVKESIYIPSCLHDITGIVEIVNFRSKINLIDTPQDMMRMFKNSHKSETSHNDRKENYSHKKCEGEGDSGSFAEKKQSDRNSPNISTLNETITTFKFKELSPVFNPSQDIFASLKNGEDDYDSDYSSVSRKGKWKIDYHDSGNTMKKKEKRKDKQKNVPNKEITFNGIKLGSVGLQDDPLPLPQKRKKMSKIVAENLSVLEEISSPRTISEVGENIVESEETELEKHPLSAKDKTLSQKKIKHINSAFSVNLTTLSSKTLSNQDGSVSLNENDHTKNNRRKANSISSSSESQADSKVSVGSGKKQNIKLKTNSSQEMKGTSWTVTPQKHSDDNTQHKPNEFQIDEKSSFNSNLISKAISCKKREKLRKGKLKTTSLKIEEQNSVNEFQDMRENSPNTQNMLADSKTRYSKSPRKRKKHQLGKLKTQKDIDVEKAILSKEIQETVDDTPVSKEPYTSLKEDFNIAKKRRKLKEEQLNKNMNLESEKQCSTVDIHDIFNQDVKVCNNSKDMESNEVVRRKKRKISLSPSKLRESNMSDSGDQTSHDENHEEIRNITEIVQLEKETGEKDSAKKNNKLKKSKSKNCKLFSDPESEELQESISDIIRCLTPAKDVEPLTSEQKELELQNNTSTDIALQTTTFELDEGDTTQIIDKSKIPTKNNLDLLSVNENTTLEDLNEADLTKCNEDLNDDSETETSSNKHLSPIKETTVLDKSENSSSSNCEPLGGLKTSHSETKLDHDETEPELAVLETNRPVQHSDDILNNINDSNTLENSENTSNNVTNNDESDFSNSYSELNSNVPATPEPMKKSKKRKKEQVKNKSQSGSESSSSLSNTKMKKSPPSRQRINDELSPKENTRTSRDRILAAWEQDFPDITDPDWKAPSETCDTSSENDNEWQIRKKPKNCRTSKNLNKSKSKEHISISSQNTPKLVSSTPARKKELASFSDGEQNSSLSHSRNNIDKSSILEEIQSQMIASSCELEALRQLKISINWELSPLHQIDSGSGKTTSAQLIQKLGNAALLNDSKYTQEEEHKIKRSWNEFSKMYQFSNPELFFPSEQNYGYFSLGERHNFKLFLAKYLPERRLLSVYRKFINIYGVKKRGRWSEKEDRLLLDLYHKCMEDTESSQTSTDCQSQKQLGLPMKKIMSKALDRSMMSIDTRLKHLLKDKQARTLSHKDIEWTPELEGAMVHRLIKKSRVDSLEDLRDAKISYDVWRKVVEKLPGLTVDLVINHWKYYLYPQLFAQKPVLRRDLQIQLIKWLYKSKTRHFESIDWKDLSVRAGYLGSCYLFRVFRALVTNCVPKKFHNNFRECVTFLHEHCLPLLSDKESSHFLIRKIYDPDSRTVDPREEDENDSIPFSIQ